MICNFQNTLVQLQAREMGTALTILMMLTNIDVVDVKLHKTTQRRQPPHKNSCSNFCIALFRLHMQINAKLNSGQSLLTQLCHCLRL